MWKLFRRMQFAEHAEEISAFGRRERDARVAKQEREHGPESSPQHQQREDRGDGAAVELLHEHRHDEVRLGMQIGGHELAPRHYPDNREVDADINDRDGDGADQNRSRNHAPRILDFITDIADVVVTQIVVDPNAGSAAQTEEESERKVESARRKIERDARIEMGSASEDH